MARRPRDSSMKARARRAMRAASAGRSKMSRIACAKACGSSARRQYNPSSEPSPSAPRLVETAGMPRRRLPATSSGRPSRSGWGRRILRLERAAAPDRGRSLQSDRSFETRERAWSRRIGADYPKPRIGRAFEHARHHAAQEPVEGVGVRFVAEASQEQHRARLPPVQPEFEAGEIHPGPHITIDAAL